MNQDLTRPEVKASIIARINKLTPETNASWGKMNVSQMLAHCSAQVRVALGDDKLNKSVIGLLLGKWMKKSVLQEAPYSKGLPTSPTFVIRDTPDFDKSKNELITLIQRFEPHALLKEPHPFFGKMTPEEWAKATWKHLDHHLSQFGN